jgi:ribose transport system permease protein
MKMVKQMLPLIIAMAGLLLLFGLYVPNFLNIENILDLIQQISVNAILAFGMTLVILIGGIDLSVGALLALVGTTTVYVLTNGSSDHQSLLWLAIAMLSGLCVAVCFGTFNGLCAAKTKMPPFIITLAVMLVARGAALRFNEGRPIHIPGDQTLFLALGNGRLFGVIQVPVIVMLVLFLVMAVLLHRTSFGQHLYAIGGNRQAAKFTGISLVRIEIIVYIICSSLTGIAGMIHTSQLYSAEPASGVMFELNAIAAAVVGGTSFTGGRGTMYGTLIGAIIIGILDKGLNQAGVHFSLQYIVKGMVILAAVYVDVRRRNYK